MRFSTPLPLSLVFVSLLAAQQTQAQQVSMSSSLTRDLTTGEMIGLSKTEMDNNTQAWYQSYVSSEIREFIQKEPGLANPPGSPGFNAATYNRAFNKRVEPFFPGSDVLVEFWKSPNRQVKIAVSVHQSADRAKEEFRSFVKSERGEELSGFGTFVRIKIVFLNPNNDEISALAPPYKRKDRVTLQLVMNHSFNRPLSLEQSMDSFRHLQLELRRDGDVVAFTKEAVRGMASTPMTTVTTTHGPSSFSPIRIIECEESI